jgi:hypothetical protein
VEPGTAKALRSALRSALRKTTATMRHTTQKKKRT